MLLTQFAAERQLPITDRTAVIKALQSFVTKRNLAFRTEEGLLKDPVNVKQMQYAAIGVGVTIMIFAYAAIAGATVGDVQLPLILSLGFTVWHAMRLQNRMVEGGRPYYIHLTSTSKLAALPESFNTLTDDLKQHTIEFLSQFPDGVVHYGELMRNKESVQPTSLRFESENETIIVWSVTVIDA